MRENDKKFQLHLKVNCILTITNAPNRTTNDYHKPKGKDQNPFIHLQHTKSRASISKKLSER